MADPLRPERLAAPDSPGPSGQRSYAGLHRIGLGPWVIDWLELAIGCDAAEPLAEKAVVASFLYILSQPSLFEPPTPSRQARAGIKAIAARLRGLVGRRVEHTSTGCRYRPDRAPHRCPGRDHGRDLARCRLCADLEIPDRDGGDRPGQRHIGLLETQHSAVTDACARACPKHRNCRPQHGLGWRSS